MNKLAIFLFFLIAFSLKFFDLVIAQTGLIKSLNYGCLLVIILISMPFFFKQKGGFVLPVQLISFSILFSIIMAQYSWDQSLRYSASSIPYLTWFVFFLLINLNIPIKTIETVVLIYGVLYILLFLFQFSHNDVVYFGFREELKEDRGIIRVVFPGGGVFFLSCFIAINKVTNKGARNRVLWFSFAMLGVVIIVLQVTRQTIAVMLLFYVIHFMRNVRLPSKIVTIAAFSICFYIFLNSDNTISKGLAQQQKEDASYGKDYIRILAAQYFLTQFTPNTASKILGNGFYNETSDYGKAVTSLADKYGYYLSDVGIVEVYILFGLFAITGYLLIFIKSFTLTLPPNYYYLKYYIWMVMLTCFTSDILINYGFLITTILVLYCYQRLIKFPVANP